MNTNVTNTPNVLTTTGQPLFDLDMVREYWDISLPKALEETETIRAVVSIVEPSAREEKGHVYTLTEPLRRPEDITDHLTRARLNQPDKDIGISISTAVFQYTGEAPKKTTFKYTNSIAIDIDSHIKKGVKDRYKLFMTDQDQVDLIAISAWALITTKFKEFNLGAIKPSFSLMTGGGLQFVLKFERPLTREEAEKLFGLIKRAIGKLDWEQSLFGMLDDFSKVYFEVDESSADITHVQRCAGVVSQKYDAMATKINIFEYSDDELTLLKERLKNRMMETQFIEETKNGYTGYIDKIFEVFRIERESAIEAMPVDDTLITAVMQDSRAFIKPSELKNIEYELLQKIKQAGINPLDILDIERGPSSGNLTKLYCPFHEESNPSMAFYQNELFDVFKDFHDDKTYTLITLWEKKNNVSKSTAISQIAETSGITLGKTERKEFQNLENDEIINKLIEKIDTENFVYYRLASKNRTCIVRHIDSGEAFVFDGPKMLGVHILQNQLGMEDADLTLQELFVRTFQEKILIDAFEEFYPGKPTVFQKQFIKFVNLWVPNERYKRVHERAQDIYQQADGEFELEQTIDLLKRKTPWTYKYILQMVQNGDLPWFINWLSGVSKFKTMPTVPVIFGVQGAGKNLFINTVMDFYLNNEYVKVVSGDRIMQQFNSMLESTSLLVLDEGDFSTGKEVDQLKLLTGNDKILIEKKGVDATNKQKHFNVMFFSNGEVPLRHPAMDRRITYFNNEIPLLASCEVWGLTIDELVERVKSELVEFWAIVFNTKLDHKMAMANSKNGQFWKQILMQHPFGALVVKLMNNEWEDIALQLNENVSDPAEMQANLKLLETIKEQFESSGKISLTLINRYMQSLNFKMKQSIQKFIQINHLHEFGINVVVEVDDVKIQVNKRKVLGSLEVKNVLKRAYPKTAREEVSELQAELAAEDAGVSLEASQGLVPPPPPEL